MIDRRGFIGIGTAAGLLGGRVFSAAMAADAKTIPGTTVETTAGKVRGTLQGKVHAFKGVPYGADSGGSRRFMLPAKPEKWTGARDCFELGPRAPQLASEFHGFVIPEFEVLTPDEPTGEDCLRLNVWTPGVGAQAKRPVMVWLHGGGYTSGSGGFFCYDGSALAAKHDVVAITINHRLTSLGYLYLAELGGEKYAASSNLGMLDIIAALEWVRDNVAAFGGDPGSVTLFGQSGGGGKISTLMAMPAARGLFHRAIVQSGAALKGLPRDVATKNAERYLAALNLKANQVDQLQKLPVEQLLAATHPDKGPPVALEPVVDGRTLPTDPFDPTAPALSADIPLIIGTVETEVTFFARQAVDPIDAAGLHAEVKQILRKASDAQVDALIAAYRSGRPSASNRELHLIIASDATFRVGVNAEADRKADQGKAPVYQYYFTWRSPVREGKLRTFHALEIPFVFDVVDTSKSITGSGADRYLLATRMSSAWAAFARNGNPSCKELPHWGAFDTKQRATMVFNNECRLVNDPHGAERKLLYSIVASA